MMSKTYQIDETNKQQGQRKAWRIPSPKNLTFDLENQ
jgi:hypothetical protein